MSVEEFAIPRNKIEESGELLDYQLNEEQKRFFARQVLNLLT